jgi:Zn-dependent peptidase ImmA (M78 family)/DNA-binding XRE family transcriptional regulator
VRFNPKRLSVARRRHGLTKGMLAEAVGVSVRSIKAYEAGEKEPSAHNLEALAARLEFPHEFFFGRDLEEPPIDGSSFRAMSRLTAKQRNRALASGTLALALGDWIEERFSLPEPAVPRHRAIDAETAAMAVRAEWGLGQLPIRNMIELLEARGVRVFSLTEDCVEMDAYSFWRGDKPYVMLNTMKTPEHSRMDAAHELGHLVLHWRGGASGREQEREADEFGSAFLMPADSVRANAPKGGTLAQLIHAKKRWKVSLAALVYRMHKLKMLTDWQYRVLFIEIKRRYRVSEPEGIQPETSQVLQKVFKTLKEHGVSKAELARELQIWPSELDKVVFGLVLTSMPAVGSNTKIADTSGDSEPPKLRFI